MGIVQSFGDLVFPVDATAIGTTLATLDPAREIVAGLFKAAINAELSEAWTKVTDTLSSGHPLRGTSPVQDSLEIEPSRKVMTERRCAFPLLCVYRSGESQREQKTLFIDQITTTWGVDYILGPLDVGDVRKLQDVCIAVLKLIVAVVSRRSHPSYASGALQFFPDAGGISSIEIKRHSGPAPAKFADDETGTVYYALSVELETTEIMREDADEFGAFGATDYSVDVGSATELVPDMIQASTDVVYLPPGE